MIRGHQARTGSVLIEGAFVYPVMFLLLLGVILLGAAVFRYQQVAHISREASRWASVHGATWAQEQNQPPTTPQDVYNNSIAPQAAGMQLNGITYSVTWNANQSPTQIIQVVDPTTGLVQDVPQTNTVTVTVTYSWDTGMFGVIPVSCTSVNTMFY